jgi:hypothetical protein
VQVQVESANPAVAAPEGAENGRLTLDFAAGASNEQTITVRSAGVGTTVLTISTTEEACVAGELAVSVVSPPVTLMSDTFDSALDPQRWETDATGLSETGALTGESGISIEDGTVRMHAVAESGPWPGLGVTAVETFNASSTEPVIFEIDRVRLTFSLVTGTGAKQRTGIWITDSTRSNYLFFGEYATHDGAVGGWQYNRSIGQPGDTPLPAGGAVIPAFTPAVFNDRGNHRLKAIANGSTVKLYLDDVFGAEVPFPVSEGIVFGFGTYVNDPGNVATGIFDNAIIMGPGEGDGSAISAARAEGGNIVISWTGSGALQSSESVGPGAEWTDVSPAPEGNTFTTPVTGAARFYRVRQ